MNSIASAKTDQQAQAADLPLLVVDRGGVGEKPRGATSTALRRAIVIPLIIAVLFTGGIVGMYFQPPGLKRFFEVTGLVPGGGTSTPIAVPSPANAGAPAESADVRPTVVALGRLVPNGEVVTVALPFGAGDARIDELLVSVGDRVDKGETIAVLDNLGQLQSAVETAEANLNVREAALVQTRASVRAGLDEAKASMQRAELAAETAATDLERAETLFSRGIVTNSALDKARLAASQAAQDVERAVATLSRFTGETPDQQPDVLVAKRNVEAARAELNRAKRDLSKGHVRAPSAGTVIGVHVRAGEKAGQGGVVDIGDIDHMTAELEVYQSMIGRVSIGDPVTIAAEALDEPLSGAVTDIGLDVGRQTLIADDPAANTDARVVEVIVGLDKESSRRASRYTNLEVVARITTEPDP